MPRPFNVAQVRKHFRKRFNERVDENIYLNDADIDLINAMVRCHMGRCIRRVDRFVYEWEVFFRERVIRVYYHNLQRTVKTCLGVASKRRFFKKERVQRIYNKFRRSVA